MNIKGIAASAGIAIAKAYVLQEADISIEKKQDVNIDNEIKKLKDAISVSSKELEIIRDKTKENIDEEHAAIFDAHIQIINDPEIYDKTVNKINSDQVNADYALDEVTKSFISIFESMDNDYMKERAADIKDVTKRVLSHILGIKVNDPTSINEEVIVIADDLTPSSTAQLNKMYVLGFITNIGGRTSHSAIMARSLEIPAIVGTKTIVNDVKDGDMIILDGLSGEVIINPSTELIEMYQQKQEKYESKKLIWNQFKDKPSKTIDGHQVELSANIGSPDDVDGILRNGGEGVGLYRTEFLYMGRDRLPTEDEQFEAYKEVLENLEGKPVVIRTLDIGGDKELPYLQMPKEMNPFLGYRAIRLCLDRIDLFKTQLRALLRSSIYGNLKIMFPMIATVDEFITAKSIFLETKRELKNEGIKVSDDIEVGMMVEIPAAAILANQFAKVVDFFSIGTNDLIQYTFAADRMNDRVSYLYQPYNPSLLRLIKIVIDAAHKEGKWAGMCGEMAGDTIAIPILLGLGLDEFSMSATSILPARHLMSKLDKKESEELALLALNMNNNEDVKKLVEQYLSEVERNG